MQQIIVIGGGAAGFFSAIRIAERHPTLAVTILERGRSVLEKVRISGGGRCNVTHACWEPRELVKHYPRGGTELLGPFSKFACGDSMAWFADRGVALKIEDDGRVFPESDSSQTIIDCLWGRAKALNIRVLTGQRVTDITAPACPPDPWKIEVGAEYLYADRLVVTTGSNPTVWKLLGKLGHRIVPPVPSLFALNIRDPRLRGLAGISLPWVSLSIAGYPLLADGPLLITHRGLSGPAVLRLSAWGARDLHPRAYTFELTVNYLGRRREEVDVELRTLRGEAAKRRVGKRAAFDLPLRLWQSLVAAAGIGSGARWAELTNASIAGLASQLTQGSYPVTGKATNKEEFTTAGGVDLREVDFRNFRSKRYPSLQFAGEVLDIDAITGGFNFQAAWTGGYLIGEGLLPPAARSTSVN